MGLTVYVFRNPLGDFTNQGVSAQHDQLTIVNLDGPSEPSATRPAVMLVDGHLPGNKILVPVDVDDETGNYVENLIGPMFGGNYAACSDSRFKVGFYGAVPIHDRYETVEQYASYD